MPLLAILSTVGCDGGYPLEPTFCDDWCRALRRVECSAEPDRCVRNCEEGLAGPQCFPLQEELLACYQRASADDFVCAGSGWRSNPRPRSGVCEAERDALVGCEYPEAQLCFTRCRDYVAAVAVDGGSASDASSDDAGDPDAGVAMDAGVEAGSSAAADRCLPDNLTCENFCWDLLAFASSATDASSQFSLNDADRVLTCIFDPEQTCEADAGGRSQLEALLARCLLGTQL